VGLVLWFLVILKLILEILKGWRKCLKVIDLSIVNNIYCPMLHVFACWQLLFVSEHGDRICAFFVWTYPRWSWGTYLSCYKLFASIARDSELLIRCFAYSEKLPAS
jgi:hypothetical protein